MSRIYISVTNDLVADQRVHRIACSLMKSGTDVTLIGRRFRNSLPLDSRSYHTIRLRLLFNKGFLFYAAYNIRLFFLLLFSRFDALVSNDLDTLPANYFISKLRRKKLIYDSHELFTEVPELIGRKRVQNIWRQIESFILPKLKFSYTVSPSIAKYYNVLYHINMKVVRNLPLRNVEITGSPDLPDLPKKKIIIYQGAINLGRGLEKVIKAMRFLENTVFVIVGDGDIRQQTEKMVIQEKLEEKVIFTGRISFNQIKLYTTKAHLGVSLEENIGLNYYYSLPNKLFDYIQAGIPVLASDFPETSNIVNTYNIGMTTGTSKPKELAEIIQYMLTDEKKRSLWKENLNKAAIDLCWEEEEEILLSIYEDAGII